MINAGQIVKCNRPDTHAKLTSCSFLKVKSIEKRSVPLKGGHISLLMLVEVASATDMISTITHFVT